MAAQALLQGEAERLTRVAIERALQGDATALRLCLERLVPPPKDAPIRFAMPRLKTAADAAAAAGTIVAAVSGGELTPAEGAHVMGLIADFRRVLEVAELERRICALEADHDV